MPGRGAALENLDDDHASAAAWARVREGGRLVAIIIIGICSLALGLLATEQLAGACDVVGAGSLGEQAVVSDAVSDLHMQKALIYRAFWQWSLAQPPFQPPKIRSANSVERRRIEPVRGVRIGAGMRGIEVPLH